MRGSSRWIPRVTATSSSQSAAGSGAEDRFRYLPDDAPEDRSGFRRVAVTRRGEPRPLVLRRDRPRDRAPRGAPDPDANRPGERRDRDRQYPMGPGDRPHARGHRGAYLFAAQVFDELGYRRFEWKCNNANEPSKRAARAVRVHLRRRVSPAYGGQGREPRHGLVLDARPGMAGAAARPTKRGSIARQFRRERASAVPTSGRCRGRRGRRPTVADRPAGHRHPRARFLLAPLPPGAALSWRRSRRWRRSLLAPLSPGAAISWRALSWRPLRPSACSWASKALSLCQLTCQSLGERDGWAARGQDRVSDGGGAGHRPGDGGGLPSRRARSVIATDKALDKLDGLDGAERHELDVLSTAAVDALAAKVGPVDILFNCAGFVHHGTVLDMLRGGLGLLLRPQRQGDASHDQGVPAGHAAPRAAARSSTSRPAPPRCAASRTAMSTARPRRR